jgi:Ni,Fe-hydrogenase III large subunit
VSSTPGRWCRSKGRRHTRRNHSRHHLGLDVAQLGRWCVGRKLAADVDHCQGVEEILGLEIPERARFIRTFIGELERIQSHLFWVGTAGHETGWDTLLMYTWRDRERVNDMLEQISGNRIHYAMNTIGGVRAG